MGILSVMRTLVTAIGLEGFLLGKEVITSSDASLGVVKAVEKELSRDEIWMVVDSLGREIMVPIEEIVSVARNVILLDDARPDFSSVDRGQSSSLPAYEA